jgi:hypothetical protein
MKIYDASMLFRMARGNSQHLEIFQNWLIPVENKSYAGLPQHYAIFININGKYMAEVINSIEEPQFTCNYLSIK